MFENNIISKKRRKSLHIEIPNKEITFCDTRKFNKFKINEVNKTNFVNSVVQNKNTEDDYSSIVYNESICKDKLSFGNINYGKKYSLVKSNSDFFNLIKRSNDNKNFCLNYFDRNMNVNSDLHLSFENKNQNLVLDEKSLIQDNSENIKNLNKLIKLFSFLNKKWQNKLQNKIYGNNIYQNNYLNNKKSYCNKISSKFSRKQNKKIVIKENNNNSFHFNKRNNTELYIDLERELPKNNIIKLDRLNNISNKFKKENINQNKNYMKKINFKIFDAYIMNSDYNDTFEKEGNIILKGNNLSRSMKKIDIKLNDKSIINNNYLKISKIRKHSINFSNPKKIKSEKKNKPVINDYMNIDDNNNIIYKTKKNNEFIKHKIIKKRVILEEEYIVNSEGDQKLLSIKRLSDDGNNEKNNNTLSINNNYIKKKVNIESNINKKNKLNNSFYSSIIKDKSRKIVPKTAKGINSKEVDSQNNYIFNVKKNKKLNFIQSKNIDTNPSLIKNKKDKSFSKILNKSINKLPVKTCLKENKSKEQKLINEPNNKEQNVKKKLFYNRIYINKFNKSNNNSKINFHPNYINSNRTSINFNEDKERSKLENSRSIYNKISFSKKEPFMIYHKEEKSQNFYINNNNQNCSNMVNIVFLNDEQNKNYEEMDRPRAVCGLKRNNYKFHEIKSISIDNNNNINTQGMKSTRNHTNKNIINVSSCDDTIGNKNNNYSIYSSMDNVNNNKIKNFQIIEYSPTNPKFVLNNFQKKYIKKSAFNKKGNSHYFIEYNE